MRYTGVVVLSWWGLLMTCLVMGCGDGGAGPGNAAPVISSLTATPGVVDPSGSSLISCMASDRDGDSLSYAWDAAQGTIQGTGATITWTSPLTAGSYTVGSRSAMPEADRRRTQLL